MQRTAKLFKNGSSQAVRLPSEFRFQGDEVAIRKDPQTGDVILSPRQQNLDRFFELLQGVPQEERDAFHIPRDRSPVRVPKLAE